MRERVRTVKRANEAKVGMAKGVRLEMEERVCLGVGWGEAGVTRQT